MIDVLYVDNHILVLNKPAGVPTVPDDSLDESLLDQAKAWIKVEFDKPGNVFLGVVQRLDRPVSGVIVFARTSKAAGRLTKAFGCKTAHKTYWALGSRSQDEPIAHRVNQTGELQQWLAKDRDKNRVSMFRSAEAAPADAKLAITRWQVRGMAKLDGQPIAQLEFEPVTGRSHQLRIAARTLGWPLLGDVKYARGMQPLADRSIALHARALKFEHPTTKQSVRFVADTPKTSWWELWRTN